MASLSENEEHVNAVKKSLESPLKKAFSDPVLLKPPSSVLLDKKCTVLFGSNPVIHRSNQEKEGVKLDSATSSHTTVSHSALEIEEGSHDPTQCSIFLENCKTTEFKRTAWMWITGIIDTVFPLFFTLIPIVFAAFGVVFPVTVAEAYDVLYISYLIQFAMGIMMISYYLMRQDKYLLFIIAAYIAGTVILSGCNMFFVFSTMNHFGAHFGGFRIAQYTFSCITMFRGMFAWMWLC